MKKIIIPILGMSLVLSACGGATSDSSQGATAAKTGGVSVTNCGEEVTFDKANELFVNDGNIISIALAAGAGDKIKYVSSLQRDKEILRAKFGDQVDSLNDTSKDYPSLETVVAKHPDVFIAGWNYGFSEEKNLTPETLKAQGISSYILSESCKQGGSNKRGVYDPWEAVKMDLSNIGAITNNKDSAESAVKDLDDRLESLKKLKAADKNPTFLFLTPEKETLFTLLENLVLRKQSLKPQELRMQQVILKTPGPAWAGKRLHLLPRTLLSLWTIRGKSSTRK